MRCQLSHFLNTSSADLLSAASAAAMFLYPTLAHQLGLSDRQAGFMLGASIHYPLRGAVSEASVTTSPSTISGAAV